MSSGPIKAERDAWKRDRISTPDAHRVCASTSTSRGYCGRTSAKTRTTDWRDVTCADCRAAGRADGLEIPEEVPRPRAAEVFA